MNPQAQIPLSPVIVQKGSWAGPLAFTVLAIGAYYIYSKKAADKGAADVTNALQDDVPKQQAVRLYRAMHPDGWFEDRDKNVVFEIAPQIVALEPVNTAYSKHTQGKNDLLTDIQDTLTNEEFNKWLSLIGTKGRQYNNSGVIDRNVAQGGTKWKPGIAVYLDPKNTSKLEYYQDITKYPGTVYFSLDKTNANFKKPFGTIAEVARFNYPTFSIYVLKIKVGDKFYWFREFDFLTSPGLKGLDEDVSDHLLN